MKPCLLLLLAAFAAAAPAVGESRVAAQPPETVTTPIVGLCPTPALPPVDEGSDEAECLPDELPAPQKNPFLQRLLRYAQVGVKHRLNGLASYYASKFDGRRTANGEVFRNKRYSAAHLTLPLVTWVEVRSRATGRSLRLRVNDRGPFVKKFALDLSQAAARYLGVDTARDRHVDIRIIALPGEEPLPEEALSSVEAMAEASREHLEAPVTAAVQRP